MSAEPQTPMFSGSEFKSLDPKFRLTIPMKFKEQLLLDPSGAEKVVVSRWENECLAVHPLTEWSRVMQRINRGAKGAAKRKYRTVFLGTAQQLDLDKQNRILLPQALRDWAGIKRDVVLVGDIARFAIWDAARWAEHSGDMSAEDYANVVDLANADDDWGPSPSGDNAPGM
ncbi:division/cell wall cluster transcriptional repressor MraZ [Candidatus Sumerlaeota bacterium]|nr:division/cell wall cluster transcriptional repressor MraZ [Candidatus Sumerlaeota bacterium]